MRAEIKKLVALGPLPAEGEANEKALDIFTELLTGIDEPVSDDEARALVRLFGSDDCYGLAWTLLHLIETAPNWPLWDVLENSENEWISRLRRSAENA